MKRFLILLLVLVIAGCSSGPRYKSVFTSIRVPTVYQAYSGELGAIADSGVVVNDEVIYVVSIDGKPANQFGKYGRPTGIKGEREQFLLKPGAHMFEVCFSDGNSYCTQNLTIPVSIAAGEFKMIAWKDAGRRKWSADLIDAGYLKDEIIADYQEAMAYKK